MILFRTAAMSPRRGSVAGEPDRLRTIFTEAVRGQGSDSNTRYQASPPNVAIALQQSIAAARLRSVGVLHV